MRQYLKVMKAVADGTRVKILKMLETRDLCVCEMQAVLRISQPSVSRHLRLLEDADLVRSQKEGMWTNFRLAKSEEVNQYSKAILDHLKDWLEDDQSIQKLLEQAQVVDRNTCSGQQV
jgi:ArsR family transcriptional regulator